MAEGFQTFEHAGKVYKVSRLTQAKKTQFEDISKAAAVAAVTRAKDVLTDDEYQEAYDRVMERVAGGTFAFHSPFTQKSLKTHGGVLLLSRVLFGVGEEEMLELFKARGPEVRAVIDLVVRESNAAADPPGAA